MDDPQRRGKQEPEGLELQYSEQARATARVRKRITMGTRTNAITKADFLVTKDKAVGILKPRLSVW